MKNDQKIDKSCWNILIVEDKENLHTITINAFFDEVIENKEIHFLSAYNEKEAIDLLEKYHHDIAVMILDMVMDTNGDEGIRVLNHLTDILNNKKMQVILRTGYVRESENKNVKTEFPDIIVLGKGETDVKKLIQLVTNAIQKFTKS